MAVYKKICAHCGTPFDAERSNAKYHNDSCRVAASRNKTPTSSPVIPDSSEDTAPKKNIAEANASKDKEQAPVPAIPGKLRLTREELIAKMNLRLEEKGMPPIQSEMAPIEFVRTGYREIDELTAPHDVLGWGGLPRKHITEVFGTKGAGKTSLMKQIVNFNTYNPDTGPLSVLYIDVENGLINPPANVIVSNNPLIEQVEEMICRAVEDDDYDLIVVDSVAMLSTTQMKDGDREAMMAKPKAMSRLVQRLTAFLRIAEQEHHNDPEYTGTAVVFINQLRDTGNSFGVKEFTPGGRALEYGASLRLELRSAKADKMQAGGKLIGQKVRVKIEKSRFNGGDVGTTVIFPLRFAEL